MIFVGSPLRSPIQSPNRAGKTAADTGTIRITTEEGLVAGRERQLVRARDLLREGPCLIAVLELLDEIQKIAGLIAAADIVIVRCLGHVEFVDRLLSQLPSTRSCRCGWCDL